MKTPGQDDFTGKSYQTIKRNIILILNYPKDKKGVGLPWWRSGWESTCQSKDMGSSPGLGRSHMPQSN